MSVPRPRLPSQSAIAKAAAAKLGLGTAQFGLDHGASSARRIAAHEASLAMAFAAEAGIQVIDTGADYGEAEALVGASLPRPSPFRIVAKTIRAKDGCDALEHRARLSLQRLGVDRADVLLCAAADLLGPDGPALWDRMKRLRDEGLFARIGVSAYAEDDPLGLARRFRPEVMQVPTSLLDQRLIATGALAEVAALGVEVQLHSIFLQGLLFVPRYGLPRQLADAGPSLSRIRRTLAEAGADPLQAALAFALARPEASTVVVGVATAAELQAIVAAAAAPPPALDWGALALDHDLALDPKRWAAA